MARSEKPMSVGDILNKIAYDGSLQAMGVYDAGADSLLSGQNSTLGTSAGTLGTQACSQVLVQASAGNGVKILYVGHTATSTPLELKAGEAIKLPVSNVNLIYGKIDSGTGTANWVALPDWVP